MRHHRRGITYPKLVHHTATKRSLMRPLLVTLLVVLVLGSSCVVCSGWEKSSGTRTAELIKLSHKGLFVKSWEGQLHILMKSAEGAFQPWAFTVRQTPVAEALQLHTGHEVSVAYQEYAAAYPWLYDTSYDVTHFACQEADCDVGD